MTDRKFENRALWIGLGIVLVVGVWTLIYSSAEAAGLDPRNLQLKPYSLYEWREELSQHEEQETSRKKEKQGTALEVATYAMMTLDTATTVYVIEGNCKGLKEGNPLFSDTTTVIATKGLLAWALRRWARPKRGEGKAVYWFLLSLNTITSASNLNLFHREGCL